MKRFFFFCLLLTAYSLLFTSCDITKSLFRKKEKTETTETHEASTQRRESSDSIFQLLQSRLSQRDGFLHIQFGDLTSIDISADGAIRATGYNAQITSHTSTTDRDTTVIHSTTSQYLETDSSSSSTKETLNQSSETQREKVQKTQKIWPILILVLAILIFFLVFYLIRRYR